MRRLRVLVVVLILWLILFFSIERFIAPVNISRVAYPFAPVMALITLLFRPQERKFSWGLLLAPIPLFLITKALAGYSVVGAALPLTVTEICAITITTILALGISAGLGEFEEAVAHITLGRSDEADAYRMQGQAEMYREVRRARRYHRPLALVAIGLEDHSIQIAFDRIMREAQEMLMKRHLLSDVARTLCDELEDYNLIAQQADRFMVLLPEMSPENIAALMENLRREVAQQTGVELKFGAAHFPDDAVTFESLIEKANREVTIQLRQASAKPAADKKTQRASPLDTSQITASTPIESPLRSSEVGP